MKNSEASDPKWSLLHPFARDDFETKQMHCLSDRGVIITNHYAKGSGTSLFFEILLYDNLA